MIVNMERLRRSARGRVRLAVNRGDLPKANALICVDCGNQAQVWDHRDYTKPLDVDAVCKRCDSLRGAGIPLPGSPDMDIEWITRPTIERRWRWLDINVFSGIIHKVDTRIDTSLCGIRRSYWSSTAVKENKKCKRCLARASK